MSKKAYDVVAIVGKRKDDKPNYVNCGVVIQTDKGYSLKLNSIPAGNEWNGWFNLFEPRPREQQGQDVGLVNGEAVVCDKPRRTRLFQRLNRHR